MRRKRVRETEESDINLTPMLDVVFIMLIFFIVTASFVRARRHDWTWAQAQRWITHIENEQNTG